MGKLERKETTLKVSSIKGARNSKKKSSMISWLRTCSQHSHMWLQPPFFSVGALQEGQCRVVVFTSCSYMTDRQGVCVERYKAIKSEAMGVRQQR